MVKNLLAKAGDTTEAHVLEKARAATKTQHSQKLTNKKYTMCVSKMGQAVARSSGRRAGGKQHKDRKTHSLRTTWVLPGKWGPRSRAQKGQQKCLTSQPGSPIPTPHLPTSDEMH